MQAKEEVQILYMYVLNIHTLVIKAYKNNDLNDAYYLISYEKQKYDEMMSILKDARFKDFFCFNMYQEVEKKMIDINYALDKFKMMKNVYPKLSKRKYHYSLLLLQKNNILKNLNISSFTNEGQEAIKTHISKLRKELNKNKKVGILPIVF